MRFDLGGALRDAWRTWRRDRAVIAPVAGMFFVLPTALLTLAMPGPPPAGETPAAIGDAINAQLQAMAANLHWILGRSLAELFGTAVLLTMILSPERPTVGEALRASLRRLPVLVLAWLVMTMAINLGLLLFVLPGLYVLGRLFVALPVLVAEPRRSVRDAIVHAVTLTHGRGILLFAMAALLFGGGQVAAVLAGGVRALGQGAGAFGAVVGALAVGVAGAVMSTGFALVRAAVYRRLGSASNG